MMDDNGTIHPVFQKWRTSGSKSNAIIKTAQNISETNFQSCYANNKAEKFKLQRLRQGIESCSQAHLTEFRREQRIMEQSFHSLEREKKNHKTRKTANIGSKQLLVEGSYHCPNCETTYLEESCDEVPCQAGSGEEKLKSNYQNKGRRSGKEQRKGKKKKPLRKEFKQVVPFYLQKNYTHYHYDPRYDGEEDSSQSNSDTNDIANDGAPCWRKESNPLALWEAKRRRSSLEESESLKKISAGFHDAVSASIVDLTNNMKQQLGVTASEKFESNNVISSANIEEETGKSPLQTTVIDKICSACAVKLDLNDTSDERIQPRVQDPSPPSPPVEDELSVLTTSEREQISKHNKVRRKSLPTSHIGNEMGVKNKEEVAQPRCYNNPAKVELLKKVVKNRLSKGDKVQDMAKDTFFDNVLELCDDDKPFPAHDPDSKFTNDDYRALRKCKYIRMSDMNIQSLKEGMISSLGE